MDKSRAMKVDTIQAIFESNQTNLDEGWYEWRPYDMIQTRQTQDQRKQLIWINALWFDSHMTWFKDSWIESDLHDLHKPISERNHDKIQTNLNQIKCLEKICHKNVLLCNKKLET